jgi:NADH:ubiquinone oxidoreductase subunit E
MGRKKPCPSYLYQKVHFARGSKYWTNAVFLSRKKHGRGNKMKALVALQQEFSQQQITKLDAIIAQYKGKPGNLIQVLEEAQRILEYLPASAQQYIALQLNIPVSKVFGVVTFYSFFTMKPRGRNVIRVCLGTACYVRGGKVLAESIQKMFGLSEGDTTDDRRFTYESVRCLGACGLGPVVVVNEDVHGRVKPSKVKELLEQYA